MGHHAFSFQGNVRAANQNVHQPRMPAMNNGQVPGGNVPVVMGMPVNVPAGPNNMTPACHGNQGLQSVQNPNGQFMVSALLSFCVLCLLLVDTMFSALLCSWIVGWCFDPRPRN